MMQQKERTYRMIYEYKDAWKPESFRERYSEVLDRYDYIVGDWGYNQLRLKGFYRDDNPKATKETSISCLQEYLQEYCNFGCAYFVIEKVNPADRINLDVGRSEPSITISELPANDRYAEWKAFLDKLQEEREQQKENGEEKQGRRPNRSGAVTNGAGSPPGNGRKNENAAQDRQDAGVVRQTGYGRQQGEASFSKPSAAGGEDRHRRGGRSETEGRSEKRQAAEPQHDRPGKRRGDGQPTGRDSAAADGIAREVSGDSGQQGRHGNRNRGGHAQSHAQTHVPQDNDAAPGENRHAGKSGHKRPWHRNRKFRHHGKTDRPRQAGQDGKGRSDGGAGEPS